VSVALTLQAAEGTVLPTAPVPGADAPAEAALIRRAQAGDDEAFAQLVEQHRRAVYRAAYAALGSMAEADDAAQETFVAVHRKLGGFRGEAAFRTWVLSIAWRKALDRRRSLRRWLRLSAAQDWRSDDEADPLERAASPAVSQEDQAATRELRLLLRRLILRLPRKHRDTLLLAASGEYSYEQIAAMLRVPTGTVKWRVSEARRLLKAKLTALGVRE